jgi:hemoglobin
MGDVASILRGRAYNLSAMSEPRQIYVPAMRPGDVPPAPRIFDAMGEDNVRRMLRDVYDLFARSEIAGMFPATPDALRAASEKSALFFIGLFGGPPLYQTLIGNPMMRARHMPFEITPAARLVWLGCFETVLACADDYAIPPAALPQLRAFLRGFSMWMVNTAPPDEAEDTKP